MSDNIPMPDGLTTPPTQDIPLSSKLDDLLSINTDIWNTSDAILKNDKKTDSLQIKLLTDIFKKLSDEKPQKPTEDKPDPKAPDKEDKRQDKFFEGLNNQFEKFTSKVGSVTSNLYDNFMPSLLGPLNLITQPLSELTGLNPLESLKTGMKGLFGKKASKKPSAEEVAKGGFLGAGFLYMTNMMSKWFGKGGSEEGGGGLSSLLSGGLGGLLAGLKIKPSTVMKGLGVASLIAGIGLMISDGFEGALLAEEWGVDKISGIIGGVLGGSKKGINGMFANAPKMALTGVGIGMIGGPIGMLLGGLIGAVLGGVLGFIGGEEIAKLIQSVTDWASGEITEFITGRGVAKRLKDDTLTNADELYMAENYLEDTEKLRKKRYDAMENNKGQAKTNLKNEVLALDQDILRQKAVIKNEIAPRALADPTSINEEFNKAIETRGERVFGSIKEGFSTVIGEIGEIGEGFSNLFGSTENTSLTNMSDEYGDKWTNMDDGIITKDGQIIHTSQDDNIIATKNDPRSIVKMPDMSNTNNMTVDNSKTNSILKELLSVMKEKSMGTNVYSNQGTTSLEAVRMLGVAQ